MNEPEKLSLFQQRFSDLLIQKETTAAIDADHQAGMQIYRANQAGIIQSALADTYPTALRLLGTQEFNRLGAEYFQRHTFTSDSLDDWSLAFADDLQKQEYIKSAHPALIDLLRLEQTIQQLELAPEQSIQQEHPTYPAFIQFLQKSNSAEAYLSWSPTVEIVWSQFDIQKLYQELSNPEIIPEKDAGIIELINLRNDPDSGSTTRPFLITRLDYEIFFKKPSLKEAWLLQSIKPTCTLADFPDLERYHTAGGDPEQLEASDVQEFLKQAWNGNWIQINWAN